MKHEIKRKPSAQAVTTAERHPATEIRAGPLEISSVDTPGAGATLYPGDYLDLLRALPKKTASLVVTSPPYKIGKEYEKREGVQDYIDWQKTVIEECHRVWADDGSICWQVGNYVNNGSILPIDLLLHPIFERLGMKMRSGVSSGSQEKALERGSIGNFPSGRRSMQDEGK